MRRALLICATLTVTGCSTLDTYLERPTVYNGLPQGLHVGYPPQVATLSMDASRRLMIMKLGDKPTSCSEPAPDAVTSLLTSTKANANLKIPNGETLGGTLQDAFNANAVLIANRTAAVEFWRTTSFEYCQLLMNNMDPAPYLKLAEAVAKEFTEPAKPQTDTTATDQVSKPGQATPPTQPAQAGAAQKAGQAGAQHKGAARKDVKAAKAGKKKGGAGRPSH